MLVGRCLGLVAEHFADEGLSERRATAAQPRLQHGRRLLLARHLPAQLGDGLGGAECAVLEPSLDVDLGTRCSAEGAERAGCGGCGGCVGHRTGSAHPAHSAAHRARGRTADRAPWHPVPVPNICDLVQWTLTS